MCLISSKGVLSFLFGREYAQIWMNLPIEKWSRGPSGLVVREFRAEGETGIDVSEGFRTMIQNLLIIYLTFIMNKFKQN